MSRPRDNTVLDNTETVTDTAVIDDSGPGGSSAKTSHRAGSANHQIDSKETQAMASGIATAFPNDDLPDDDPHGVDPETGLVGPVVFDAEVVPDEEETATEVARRVPGEIEPRKPGAVVVRRAGVVTRRETVRVVAGAWTVATHPHTRTAGKLVGRNLWYPVAGLALVVRRWRDAHGPNRYERMMRQAELVGNQEALLEWESRDVAEKARRHQRVMDWVASPLQLVKAGAVAAGALTGLLLALGVILALAHKDVSEVLAPITAVIDAVAFLVWFLSVYGATMLLAATATVVALLWHTGRAHTEAPAWMAPAADAGAGREVIPDEGAILNALRNLNLSPLNKKFKEGWQPRWVLATGRDGKGYRTQLELPAGVTVEMINKQKAVLAHNLVRLPVEVWPTEPKKQPGVLDLWVADQGLLTGPVEPYPLLTEGETDYFKGVPAGVDQRGALVVGKLMACNYAAAGIMGSGKTSLVIELLCGAMLDPLVDIEVYVMAYNVDYDPMRPVLDVLVKGDEDTHITAAMNALQALREEVTERGKLLEALGGEETKVTREIAERDPRMRPKVVVFDECQELFRHDKHGAAAKELAIKLMMKARKCAITLIFLTPAPSADSLPRDLAKTVSHSVCFAIGDHQGNDAILGTGAHKRGITAVDLVPGEDVGTAMASGFSARPGLLRTHHIQKDKKVDQLTPIVERAVALRKGVKKAPPRVDADNGVDADRPDLLADVAAVMRQAGKELMRTHEVLHGLAAHNPDAYAPGGFGPTQLRDGLPDAAKPYKTKGYPHISAQRIAEALADRDLYPDTADSDTGDGADGGGQAPEVGHGA